MAKQTIRPAHCGSHGAGRIRSSRTGGIGAPAEIHALQRAYRKTHLRSAAFEELEAHACARGPRQNARTRRRPRVGDRKSTRLNSSHTVISYAVFCLKKKKR